MKMKNIIYLLVIALILPLLLGCEDFLDTRSYTTKDGGSFPKTPDDANQLVTGIYAQFNQIGPMADYFFLSDHMSDDRFGGGGENDKSIQAISHLMYANPDEFGWYWSGRYTGIARANVALDALKGMEEYKGKSQKIGEAKFLRAHWYFELVQLLGDIPLVTEVPQNAEEAKKIPPQSTQDEIFTQIATDLWEAYNEMDATSYKSFPSGTATKWAAAGLLARVYLFYTGFYGKDALPREGGSVSKADVVAALELCMDKTKSGHDLVTDFRQLWGYSNTATGKDYPFTADLMNKGLSYLEGSDNQEVIFAVKFTNVGKWWPGGLVQYSNQIPTFSGFRQQGDYSNLFPITEGWGFGPVNTKLWTQWKNDDPNDIRRIASIFNLEDEAPNPSKFTWGGDSQMEETGLWQKKMTAIGAWTSGPGSTLLQSFIIHPDYLNTYLTRNDYQLDHGCDVIRIRFADILLMHSELTRTVGGINRVRARAGLPPIGSYSLEALQKERRYELAFEGLRWGDIRRWGIAEEVLGTIYGVDICNYERWTIMKPQSPGGVAERYRATKGFFNKPRRELDLSNGAYTQNAGWDTPAANFIKWLDE